MVVGSPQVSSLFCAAAIVAAHGVQGHVKVKCFLEDPTLLKTYSPFLNEEGEPVYKVEKILSQDKGIFRVSLEGVVDRTKAESLKGAKLMLASESLPQLPDDTYYHRDLIGLSVFSKEGKLLGTIHALYNFGAGELLEIKTSKGNLSMIPFTHEIVPEINLEKGTLSVSQDGEIFLMGEEYDA